MAEEQETTRQWSKDVTQLGDKIVGLSLLQAQELGDYLEDVHGIAPAAAAVAVAGPAAAEAAAIAEAAVKAAAEAAAADAAAALKAAEEAAAKVAADLAAEVEAAERPALEFEDAQRRAEVEGGPHPRRE